MNLAFIITARIRGTHPKTTIVYSSDVAVMSLAAYLRPHTTSDTPYATAVKEAELCVATLAENPYAAVEVQWGEARVSIIRSRLAGE